MTKPVDPHVWPEIIEQRKLAQKVLDASQMLFQIGTLLRKAEVPYDSRPIKKIAKLADEVNATGPDFFERHSRAEGISHFVSTLEWIYSSKENPLSAVSKEMITEMCQHWAEHFPTEIDHTFLYDLTGC